MVSNRAHPVRIPSPQRPHYPQLIPKRGSWKARFTGGTSKAPFGSGFGVLNTLTPDRDMRTCCGVTSKRLVGFALLQLLQYA
jgi:hypothetical protein